MPGLDGASIATLLQQNPHTRDARIVLYSAMPEEDLCALTKAVPSSEYVSKADGLDALADLLTAEQDLGRDLAIRLRRAGSSWGPIRAMSVSREHD